jgi:hypothetical protein
LVQHESSIVEPEPIPEPLDDLEKLRRKNAMVPIVEVKPKFVPHVTKIKMTSYHQFMGTAHLGEYNKNTKES